MEPNRRSTRVIKPRVRWAPTITHPRGRQPPAFTIYTEPLQDLSTQLPEHLSTQRNEGLNEGLNTGLSTLPSDENLCSEPSNDDLGSEPSDDDLGYEPSDDDLDSELSDNDLGSELSDEGLDEGLDEDLDQDLDEGLDEGLDEDLDQDLDEDLSTQFFDEDLSEDLSRQLHEGLGVDPPYQPRFLPKDRAGKPQNLPEDPNPLKLFQLFFTVKEIENIVKQTNQHAAYIDFKRPWKPLTVTEVHCYLGCLVYMAVQPLRGLSDHWGHLKSPVARCFTARRFKQIRRAFVI